MKKKALMKDTLKEIKNTFKRFLSILLMAFLGVGFFAGIRASSPDMVNTIDSYYKSQNFYDIQVLSTLGLTQNDVDEISKVDGVNTVVPTFETDGKVTIGNKEVIVRTLCVEDVNAPLLLEGRLPIKENECAVEKDFLKANNKQIGDNITLEIEDMTDDEGEKVKYLKETELKIVGTVQSPNYISRDRGTSKLGAGKVNYYMYLPRNNINANSIYTAMYIKVDLDKPYKTSSKAYENAVEETKEKVESIKEDREKARYDELVGKATEKVEEAEETFNKEKHDGETKIADAEAEIKDGKEKIAKAEKEIRDNERKANREFSKAEDQIKKAKQEIANGEQEFKKQEIEANKGFEEANNKKKDLQGKLAELEKGLTQINDKYTQIVEGLKNPYLPPEQKQILEQTKIELEKQKASLEENKAKLNGGIALIEKQVKDGKAKLEEARNKIETGKKELAKQESTFKKTKTSTNNKLNKAKKDLETAKKDLSEGEKELESSRQEFNDKIQEAEEKLIDSRQKIADIENPKWYVLDRYGNEGYNSFIQDTQSIENIGKIFPVVFFVVAALISLTSMTRMIEEQRTQIGTLKALGYNKLQISSKYIIYSALACVVGSFLGMSVGFQLLPRIIWMMYSMMYQISPINISFNWYYGGMGFVLISLCIIGSTIYAARRELKETPAVLMRPKAPKVGKRVLLERIPFIWKKLSFSKKVTVRNIFRYKKRFLMTIIGIFGCTSLIIAGFGLKDSIKVLLPSQFDYVFCYDSQINLKSGLTDEQEQNFITELQNKEEVNKVVKTHIVANTAIKDQNEEELQIIIPEEEEALKGLINIRDKKTKEPIKLKENEIILTDKLAQLLNVKKGDTITLRDSKDKERQIKVSDIAENYIMHYGYMTKSTYESFYDKEFDTNVLLLNHNEITEEAEEELAKDITSKKEVAAITRTSIMMKTLDDTMKSLNYVVIILIVSAGLLAFVVLYNLSNVNISERIRELATIKVLGFYDKEVYLYVTRETVLLTVIGILLGLVGGYFLNYFIIGTCEINMLRFCKVIRPISYVYSILITVGFTAIVNIVTYFVLKKIDMIESLKSVE